MNLFMILTIFHPRQLSQIEPWTSAMMAWVTRPLALSLPQLEKTSWSISQESSVRVGILSQKKKHIHEWGDGHALQKNQASVLTLQLWTKCLIPMTKKVSCFIMLKGKKKEIKRKKIPDWWRWEKSTTSKVEQLWIHEERNIFILNIESVN